MPPKLQNVFKGNVNEKMVSASIEHEGVDHETVAWFQRLHVVIRNSSFVSVAAE